MAVSKNVKQLYFSIFEKPELFVANLIMRMQERNDLAKNIKRGAVLQMNKFGNGENIGAHIKTFHPQGPLFNGG